jgi:hypothetical protein
MLSVGFLFDVLNGTGDVEIMNVSNWEVCIYASWYIPNSVIRKDLPIPTVKEEICC